MKKDLKKFISTVLIFALMFSFMPMVNSSSSKAAIMLVKKSVKDYNLKTKTKIAAYKKIGEVSVDNSKNKKTTVKLTYKNTTSGSFTGTVSLASTIGGEVEFVAAKVNASTQYSVSASVSWTKGTETGIEIPVPAKSKGSITAYLSAIKTSGYMVYNAQDIEHPNTQGYVINELVSESIVPVTTDYHYVTKIS